MLIQTPVAHEITVEDYYRMGETGAFAPDARVELLDGQIFEMFPIGPFHANSVRRFLNFFAGLSQGRWLVDVQNPVRLNNRSEPQPDFVLLRPLGEEYAHRHPTPQDVFLLVEVADSSGSYDRGRKLAAYAKAGIKEYWIVNLVDRVVEIYRNPSSLGAYESVAKMHGDNLIAPEAFPDAAVTVGSLLGAA